MSITVITGGASGIGLATAKALASSGKKVALMDLKLGDSLNSLSGDGHLGFSVDVTDADSVQKIIEGIDEPIEGLVVCAGIVSEELLVDISPANFEKVMRINVFGAQNVMAPVARQMIARGIEGSIVVLASVAAFVGGGLMGRGAYATSKAAVLGLVRSYARELAGHKIRTNTVSPGATDRIEGPALEQLEDIGLGESLVDDLARLLDRDLEVIHRRFTPCLAHRQGHLFQRPAAPACASRRNRKEQGREVGGYLRG